MPCRSTDGRRSPSAASWRCPGAEPKSPCRTHRRRLRCPWRRLRCWFRRPRHTRMQRRPVRARMPGGRTGVASVSCPLFLQTAVPSLGPPNSPVRAADGATLRGLGPEFKVPSRFRTGRRPWYGRSVRPRSAVRLGALLVAAAFSGYLLGGCAGDGLEGLSGATELPTLSLPEVTVPEVTVPDVTLPDVTIPTLPEPPDTEGTTTSEPTTTTKPPITTEPATTVVKTETETETETATVTATVPTETAVAA